MENHPDNDTALTTWRTRHVDCERVLFHIDLKAANCYYRACTYSQQFVRGALSYDTRCHGRKAGSPVTGVLIDRRLLSLPLGRVVNNPHSNRWFAQDRCVNPWQQTSTSWHPYTSWWSYDCGATS